MLPQEITAKFLSINRIHISEIRNKNLQEFVYKQKSNIKNFLEACYLNSFLADYADQKLNIPYWDNILNEDLIPIDTDVYAKVQKNSSSFQLIFGFYIFFKIDVDKLDEANEQNLIDLGMRYNSYHCFHLKLICLTNSLKRHPSNERLTELIKLSEQSVNYGFPGYLLYAKTCWQLSEIDSSLIFIGLIALYMAKNLEESSANEIHNAYFGKQIEIYNFKNVDDMIKAYVDTKLISKEINRQAQESASHVFLRL